MNSVLLTRFTAKWHESPGGCWLWHGRTVHGYGSFWIAPGQPRASAHRISYQHFIGPIPDGLELDHLCRETRCVNPAHLEAVTHAENTRRHFAFQTHCKHGHLLDERNTYRYTNGRRQCRLCTAQRQREYKQRKKAS